MTTAPAHEETPKFHLVANSHTKPGKMIGIKNGDIAPANKTLTPSFRFYTAEIGADSTFDKMRGDQQRAILEEANVRLRGFELSKTYGEEVRNDINLGHKILGYYCEKFANNPEDTKECMIRMNKNDFMRTMRGNFKDYQERCGGHVARELDKSYKDNNVNKLHKILNTTGVAAKTITKGFNGFGR